MGFAYNGSLPDLTGNILEPSTRKAFQIVSEAFERYCLIDYDESSPRIFDLSRLLVAFNGGKDCTLLLDIIVRVASTLNETRGSLRLMYIRDPPDETFEEVLNFVEETKIRYKIESIEVSSGDMRSALTQIVTEHPEVKGIFMGTRSTDPNAGWMDYFCTTSKGWPQIDLIAPLLHMRYGNVWRNIHAMEIAYCELYKRGYTSIGSKSTTQPNPLLRVDETSVYLHADKLQDESKERCGRK
jgi:FAD synthetase